MRTPSRMICMVAKGSVILDSKELFPGSHWCEFIFRRVTIASQERFNGTKSFRLLTNN